MNAREIAPHVLRVRNLTKTYRTAGEEIAVLRGVNLDVAAGERVALIRRIRLRARARCCI